MPISRNALLTGLVLAGVAGLCAPRAALAQRGRVCRAHDVNLTPAEGRVPINGTSPILATTYDAAGNPCDNVTYSWSSNNPSVATVDRGGVVHGVSLGTAQITARTGVGAAAKIGRASVTVEEADVATQGASTDSAPGFHPRAHGAGQGMAAIDFQPDGSGPADVINVEPVQMQLIRGERQQLIYRALRADGSPAQPQPILFQVAQGGERVASVDTFGFVSALGEAGTATVNLTVPNQSRIQPRVVSVTVRNDSVQFSRPEIVMAPGDTISLSPYVPNQHRALAPQLFQFSSSDNAKLTVTPNAIVTAVAAGTARITARNAFVPDFSTVVHVHRRVRAVSLTPVDRTMPADSMLIIPIGGSLTLRPHALAADDNTDVPDAPISWRVQDVGGAVNPDTAHGVFRGVRSGVATVGISTLISGETQAMASLRVKVVAGGLSTPRPRLGLGVGEQTTIDVSLLDEQRNSAGSANPFLTWSSDSIARVEGGNHVVALKAGHTRLVGRTGWDSTIAVDVFVVPDMLVVGRQAGRQGVLGMNTAGQVLGFRADSLVEFVAWSPDLTRAAATIQVSPASRSPAAYLSLSDADGSNGMRLTDDSVLARYPSFVPGAPNEIVFEWNRGGKAQIWKVGVEGGRAGTPQQLTNTAAANLTPAVSPDGRHIAYVSVRETSPGRPTYGLYAAKIDGTEEHLVIAMPQGHRILGAPVFARDGQHLLFVRSEPQRLPTQRVLRIPVTASPSDTAAAVTPLDMVVRSFSVNSDGSVLALNTLEPLANGGFNPHLVLFSINGGMRTPIDPPDMRPANPVFKPATPPAPAASAAPR
ncbi:MAG: Ig-like domain-containing protein [Gemmatimonadales bacterium]